MTLLSDEVWQRLDRDAGRMTRRKFAILVSAAVLVGVLAAAGLVGWRSGVLWPNVVRDPSSAGWTIYADQHAFELTFPIRNDGLVPVDVTSAGRSGDGLVLLSAVLGRRHLPVGGSAELTLTYKVADCGAVDAKPVPLEVSRGRTAYVDAPELAVLADMACGLIPIS